MVETAPLPAGFDPIDAATLPPAPVEAAPTGAATGPVAPVRTPHPLEAWAAPGPPVEPVIRRVLPGGGYLNATATALRKLEEGEALIRRMAGPGIRHASEIAAERRQREDEAEAARRARGDPRAVLRAAIVLQAEAQAEVDHLTPLVLRARELVEDLTERQ